MQLLSGHIDPANAELESLFYQHTWQTWKIATVLYLKQNISNIFIRTDDRLFPAEYISVDRHDIY